MYEQLKNEAIASIKHKEEKISTALGIDEKEMDAKLRAAFEKKDPKCFTEAVQVALEISNNLLEVCYCVKAVTDAKWKHKMEELEALIMFSPLGRMGDE